ncbi:MAG: transglutaminase domain-containing protein [Acidobacteriota bacterium]
MKPRSLFMALSFLICVSFSNSFAQAEPPIKWGEIPVADLQMKSFPQDTNATALILCDYGESTFNDDLNIVFKRHMRIKILTAKGYDWGTHSVSLWTERNTETIHDIEGATYRLDEKGAIVKNELSSGDIFEEEINDRWTRYRFTLPALQPGCVVEFRYTIIASNISRMRDWVFQYSEPVRWSEYRMRYPKSIAYAGVKRGFESFAVDEREDVTQVFSGTALSYFNQPVVNCNYWRMAIKNAPAIREEPFITTTSDYLNQLDVQLAGYAFSGGGQKKVLNDWPTVVSELLEDNSFYKIIDDTRQVRKTAEQITAGLQSPEDKMKAIYDWVRSSIVWSGENRVFANQEVDDVLESKKGNSAEITFLLISLLKSAGIDSDPVIFSTRANGAIQDIYPIISQFNYVTARATIGTKNYLLDATDPNRPMDLLPVKILGTRGLLIRENNWGWVGVASDRVDEGSSAASIILSADGSVTGKLEKSLSAYSSLRLRQELSEKKETEIAKGQFDTERSAITLDSVSISNKDSLSLPLKIKASFSSASYAQRNGDMIYINPQIIDRLWENPFKAAIRNFPVDYAYRRKLTSTISINIPEGFEVKEKLKDITTYGGARALSFTRQTKVEGGKLIITCTTEIKEAQIKPKFYEQIRDFYAAMVSVESEQIVLSRIQEKVQPVTAPAGNGTTTEKSELPDKAEKTKSKVKKGKA